MSVTDDIKTLISGSVDDKLKVIERLTRDRLSVLMGIVGIPSEYEYIVSDVTLKRFNRIGNEGMTSYSQEGESISFPDSDFEEYMAEITEFKHLDDDSYGARKGKVRFL